MGSGARTPSSTRGGRSSRSAGRGKTTGRGKGSARDSAGGIAPLYKRLPHGPHQLARDEVIANQRKRIYGALIEAISQGGYDGTSVKQVIALAGVSRRSFYEMFANKQEAFTAAFDAIARRELQLLRRDYLAADGPLEQHVQACLRRVTEMSVEDFKAGRLVVVAAQTAGPFGVQRLRQVLSACEQMLGQSLAQTSGAVALPMPIVRCIAGGLHGMASGFLRGVSEGGRVDVAQEMLDWTLVFQTPAAERMSERLTAELSVRIREIASAYAHGPVGAEAASHDERTRMLQGVLRLATHEEYRTLSAPQIADEANVPVESFCEQFKDKDECFLEALDSIGDELLAIAADPDLVSDDWPRAVRKVLAELMRYLADHPLQTRIIAQDGFFAGAEACERLYDLASSVATLLTEGAPMEPPGQLTTEAVAGAIWHTARCQVGAGRVPLLAALSDHVTYIVLAPYIGAEAAAGILTEERLPVSRGAGETAVPQST
jgi:AcrR family transcriptional regulator